MRLPPNVLSFCLMLASMSTAAIAQVESPIPDGAELEHLIGGIEFGEGPLWHPDGFLLFSELDRNRIIKLDPSANTTDVYLSPSGGSNGLAFDPQMNLIICRRDEGDVARLESDGTVTVLVSDYRGEDLNGPNDITIGSNGTIFFTDPHQEGTVLRTDAVYSITSGGRVHRLDSTLNFFNGIVLTPDEQRLYVNAARSQTIYVYDIENDSTLTNKRVFATVPDARYLDGMKVDENGLLYVAGGGGVWIFSPEGDLVDHLPMSGNTTNLAWGDSTYKTLYITEVRDVHRIALNARGRVTTDTEIDESPWSSSVLLLPNYPNPFTTSTTVSYSLLAPAHVELTVRNQLGQVVRTLQDGHRSAGTHQLSWNGRSMLERPVANGIYLVTLTAGSANRTRTVVLVH